MTDEEIVAKLKEADALLGEYKKVAGPVAAELAKRKSIALHGVEGRYRGDLGCYEEGINTICLHIEDGAVYDRDNHDKAIDHDIDMEKKFFVDNGIQNIYMKGHF